MPPISDTLPPPLKWAGGKRWLLPQLRPLWQPFQQRRLVEPFVGGMAMALGLNPQRALLNDINPHLIHFYRHLQQGLKINLVMANDEELYYQHRAEFNRLNRSPRGRASRKAASLMYYLNRTGFNGLCRFNSKGEFNVPFGRYKTIHYQRDFTAYRAILANWELCCGDFPELAPAEDDFIYADPPYYDVQFTQYAKENFGWPDQQRLAHWLARHPGPVVLSNQATPRIIELYRDFGFTLRFMDAPRRISCTGDRTPAREVLALRNI